MIREMKYSIVVAMLVLLMAGGAYAEVPVSDGFDYPVGNRDNFNGWHTSLFLGNSWCGTTCYYGHLGEDYLINSGNSEYEPVYSASNGVVYKIYTGSPNSWGGVVIIKHVPPSGSNFDITDITLPATGEVSTNAVYTLYGHLNSAEIYVQENENVNRGAMIGKIGVVTDFPTPHLHFEIKNQAAIDTEWQSGVGHGYSGTDNSAPNHYKPSNFITINRPKLTPLGETTVDNIQSSWSAWGFFGGIIKKAIETVKEFFSIPEAHSPPPTPTITPIPIIALTPTVTAIPTITPTVSPTLTPTPTTTQTTTPTPTSTPTLTLNQTLKWPLSGKPSDRSIILGFGKNWTWGDCGKMPKKHTGVDLIATVGEDVYASEAGTVKASFTASQTYNWGKGITIEHQGFTAVYLHIVPLVSSGQIVSKGQKIATIANIVGPHLHYGVRTSPYSDISNRGALPQKNTEENLYCKNDPVFPANFVDPVTLTYEESSPAQPPQITSISPTQTVASTFDLTINGNNFDSGAIDQIYWKADGHYVGQGTILSRTSTQIVVREFMTGTTAGVYVVKVKNLDGQLSNGMDLTITAPTTPVPTTPVPTTPVPTPTLSVSPTTGQQGTTFYYSGNQYTPNGIVEWHVRKPDGVEYPPADLTGKVGGSGNFNHNYVSSCGNMVGTYTLWAFDKSTGKRSNDATEIITTSASCVTPAPTTPAPTTPVPTTPVPTTPAPTPTLSVSPTSGQQGTTFYYSGNQYTPNGIVEWHVRKPDGVEYPPADLTGRVDGSGNFNYNYVSHCESMVGTYTLWAFDKSTGGRSNDVQQTIIASASCVSVQYQAHFANTGWMSNWAQDGQTVGTPGGNQMEAIRIKTTKYGIRYSAHVANDGWLPWVYNSADAGTTGQAKSLQAIKIELQNAPSNLHVYYRVYVHGQGWQGWVSDGAQAGTTGQALAVDAIEIKIQS